MQQLQEFLTANVSTTVMIIINIVAYILYFLLNMKTNKSGKTFTTLFRENSRQVEKETDTIKSQLTESDKKIADLESEVKILKKVLRTLVRGDDNDNSST